MRGDVNSGGRALLTVWSYKAVKAQVDMGANVDGRFYGGGRLTVETPNKISGVPIPITIEAAVAIKLNSHVE